VGDVTSLRVILDTNTLLRGLVADDSAAGRVVSAAESRGFVPLLSKPIIAEYQIVLGDPELLERFPSLSTRRVELAIRRLRFVGDVVQTTKIRFDYPRDPRDGKFIELAIAGRATHLLSYDKDLLSLMASHTDAGKRFRQRLPHLQVMRAAEFLRRHEGEFRR
jgi:putative PIN family toxin of toxin-antitoxin system